MATSGTLNQTGQRTVAAIERALAGKQSATLVAMTTLLDALSQKGETVSLTELSALVKCDSPLMSRVLAQANTMGSKNSAAAVVSLPQAFHVLGISRVRSVVLSTLLAQHADTTNLVQREMAIISLADGLVAQSLAAECGDDPEQAFLCGSLRNYGHLLLATLYPAEFERARDEGRRKQDEDAGFRAVFGVVPRALTLTLLEDTHLPRELLDAIAPDSEAALGRKASAMTAYAAGAHGFSELLFDPNLTPTDFRARAHDLLARVVPEVAIGTADQLDSFLSQQRAHFADYGRYVGFAALAERPILTITRRIGNKAIPRHSLVAGRGGASPAATKSKTPPDPAMLQPSGLGRIAEGLRADEVLLFSLDSSLGEFRHLGGEGTWARERRGTESFVSGDRNIFGLCAALHQTLLIHDAAAPNIAGHIPAWMRQPHAPAAFFVMPLGTHRVSQVLLVGWTEARKVAAPSPAAILAYNQA